jgi:hypothetical protein
MRTPVYCSWEEPIRPRLGTPFLFLYCWFKITNRTAGSDEACMPFFATLIGVKL